MIFGCIANEGYINRPDEVEEYCIFNRNQNACNYGVFMGSMAFLCCMALLALDIYFPQISSVKDRKKAVLADVGVSGVLNEVCDLFRVPDLLVRPAGQKPVVFSSDPACLPRYKAKLS